MTAWIEVVRSLSRLATRLGFLALVLPAAARAQVDTSLKKEVLGDGIYLFRAPLDLDMWTSTNVVVIVNDQDVTVFDSNTRPTTTRKVIAEIRRITDKPVRTLINSHWHMDHWTGNHEYVKAFPGIRIIATTETRDYMKRMAPGFFAAEIGSGLERARGALDTAIRTGKLRNGAPLTDATREAEEKDIEETARFAREIGDVPRVLPNMVFRDTLILWSGRREFRLFKATGDASGSTVLYLPSERLLVTGDVLVAPEEGNGPPPWTTNSYAITPWLASLRSFESLDVSVIVPGQGPAFHDKAYLTLTIELYQSIISQVHTALEGGAVTLKDVEARVNVDSIGRRYTPGSPLPASGFNRLVESLVGKVFQESLDGISH